MLPIGCGGIVYLHFPSLFIIANIYYLTPHYLLLANRVGVKFAYGGIAIVVHARAVIGKNCIIGQCVTIGGRSKHYEVPVIGDNVYIGAGAKILGPITIGNNSVIGAGAVVLKSVPANSIVAGAPARVIKTGIDPKNFY